MSMLAQHLLFISLNLHRTKVHVQHDEYIEYIIRCIIFTINLHFL